MANWSVRADRDRRHEAARAVAEYAAGRSVERRHRLDVEDGDVGKAYLKRIDQRRKEAKKLGVTGIPTFVIGNQVVVACQPYDVLARFVEASGARRRPAD